MIFWLVLFWGRIELLVMVLNIESSLRKAWILLYQCATFAAWFGVCNHDHGQWLVEQCVIDSLLWATSLIERRTLSWYRGCSQSNNQYESEGGAENSLTIVGMKRILGTKNAVVAGSSDVVLDIKINCTSVAKNWKQVGNAVQKTN